MSDEPENVPPVTAKKHKGDNNPTVALTRPPRKKAATSNPWKLKGRHIGRSIHAFANFAQLILDGMQLDKDLALLPDNEIEKRSAETRLLYDVYGQILKALPVLQDGLEEDTISATELNFICASIQAGANAAHSDDIKGLKGAVLDWITDKTHGLVPPIGRDEMAGHGFNHEATGRELCPAGLDWNDPEIKVPLKSHKMLVQCDQWPIFLYLNGAYDSKNPWQGLLRGRLLVNAFKHIFTSPSSVQDSGRSTKASNSWMHGMKTVTTASIVYVATLVRFAMSTRSSFSRTDTTDDAQTFYNVLLAFLSHSNEREHVNQLIAWWNQQVFPNYVETYRAPTANSPLAILIKMREGPTVLGETSTNLAT